MRSLVASLAAAWGTLRDDPVRVLLPAGGILLLQAIGATAARDAWDAGPVTLAGTVAVALLLRALLGAPLRSRMIAVAARAHGHAVPAWGRPAALLGVEILTTPLALGSAALIGVPLALAGATIASLGWYTLGAFTVAFGVLGATLASLAVRALFGLAPVDVVVGGRPAVAAMVDSARAAPSEGLRLLALIGLGDVLVGIGALVCGAGALPAWPIADLAVLHRWRARAG
jgi:hypothetical protein